MFLVLHAVFKCFCLVFVQNTIIQWVDTRFVFLGFFLLLCSLNIKNWATTGYIIAAIFFLYVHVVTNETVILVATFLWAIDFLFIIQE